MITGKVADLTRTASKPMGVSLFEPGDPNTYRSTYDILRDISYIWDELTDKNQAQLLELLFGKTRANQGAAILSNFSQAESAMETMKNAAGSANREMEISFDSIDYHLNKLQQTWVGIAQDLIDRGVVNQVIDALTSVSELIDDIIEQGWAIPPLIGAITGAFASKNGVNLLKPFSSGNFTTQKDLDLFNIFTKTVEGQNGVFKEGVKESANFRNMYYQLSDAGKRVADTTVQAGASVANFGDVLKKTTFQAKAAALGTRALAVAQQALIGMGVALAITATIKILDELIVTDEELAEAADAAKNKISELNAEISNKGEVVKNAGKRYAELAQEVEGLGTAFQSQGKLSTDEYEEFLDLSSQLAEVFPSLRTGVTENGKAILGLNGSVETITSSLENLLKVEQDLANQKILDQAPDIFNNAKRTIDNYTAPVKEGMRSRTDVLNDREKYLQDLLNFATSDEDNKVIKNISYLQKEIIKDLESEFAGKYGDFFLTKGTEGILDFGSLDEGARSQLADYISNELNAVQKSIFNAQQAIDGANQDIANSLIAYVTKDDYLKDLSKEGQTLARQMASNFTMDMIPEAEANAIESFDDLSNWFSNNIINAIETATSDPKTGKLINEAIVALLDGNITSGDLANYWSVIQSAFSPDDPIYIYFKSIIDESEEGLDKIKSHAGLDQIRFDSNEALDSYLRNNILGTSNEELFLNIDFSKQSFANAQEFIDWWEARLEKAIEDSAKDAEATVAKTVEDYNVDVTPWIDNLGDTYGKLFHNGFKGVKGVVDDAVLKSIKDAFDLVESTDRENGGLGIDLDDAELNKFLAILSDAKSTQKQVQKGFDDYATMVFNAVAGLDNFNDKTAETLRRMMTESGIKNTDDIIDGYKLASETVESFTIDTRDLTDAERAANDEALLAVEARMKEAGATDEVRWAALNYAYEQQRAAMVNMNAEQKIAALQSIASAYLSAAQAAKFFADAEASSSSQAETAALKTRIEEAKRSGGNSNMISAMEQEYNRRVNAYERNLENSIQDALKLEMTTPPDYKERGSGGGSNKDKKEEKFEKRVDWIERFIQVIERKVENLGKILSATFRPFSTRLDTIPQQLDLLTKEIEVQTVAAEAYKKEAEEVGLAEEYALKVREGALDVETITDEKLHDQIEAYQDCIDKMNEASDKVEDLRGNIAELASTKLDLITKQFEQITQNIEYANEKAEYTLNTGTWSQGYSALSQQMSNTYDNIDNLQKQLAASQAVLNEAEKYGIKEGSEEWNNLYNSVMQVQSAIYDAKEQIQELAKQKFDKLVERFERIASVIDHSDAKLSSLISKAESLGRVTSEEFIRQQIDNETDRLRILQSEQQRLQKEMVQGKITRNSDRWWEMFESIESVKDSIVEAESALADFNKQLQELEWSKFDYLQEQIGRMADENNFLIDLIKTENELYENNGNYTDAATTNQALLLYNLEIYKDQIKDTNAEIKKLQEQMADDPANADYLARYEELIEKSQDLAKSEADTIQSLKEIRQEAYDQFLDYLQEAIDKRKEEMDVEREAYEYSRTIAQKSKAITDIQKQLAALSGGNDTTEETRLRIQKLNNDLLNAQEDLSDTEYDKWRSDQDAMLDEMYSSFETLIQQVMADTNALIERAVKETEVALIESNKGEMANVLTALGDTANTISTTVGAVVDKYGVPLQYAAETGIPNLNQAIVNGSRDTIDEIGLSSSQVATGLGNVVSSANGIKSVIDQIRITVDKMYTLANEEAKKDELSDDMFIYKKSSASTLRKAQKNSVALNKDKSEAVTDEQLSALSASKLKTVIKNKLKLHNYDSSNDALAYAYEAIDDDWKEANVPKYNAEKDEFSVSNKNQLIGLYKYLKDLGFANGGIIGKAVKRAGEDGFVLARTGEEILSLDKIKEMQKVFASMQPIVNMPKMDGLQSAIDGITKENETNTFSIDTIKFDLPDVANYEDFVRQAQADPKFERLVQQMTLGVAMGQSKLKKYSI
jgi:hypothetical protein